MKRVHYIAGCLPLRLRQAAPMVLDDRRVWVPVEQRVPWYWRALLQDRKSTRLNSSH